VQSHYLPCFSSGNIKVTLRPAGSLPELGSSDRRFPETRQAVAVVGQATRPARRLTRNGGSAETGKTRRPARVSEIDWRGNFGQAFRGARACTKSNRIYYKHVVKSSSKEHLYFERLGTVIAQNPLNFKPVHVRQLLPRKICLAYDMNFKQNALVEEYCRYFKGTIKCSQKFIRQSRGKNKIFPKQRFSLDKIRSRM
jgi:hypothetical protein